MNRVFAALLVLVLILAVAGCASKPQPADPPEIVAVQDFIAVSELERVRRIRTDKRNNYDILNKRYLIFESRHETYLVEFQRNCLKVYNNLAPQADMRYDARYLWPKADRIRGCLIGRAFRINEAEEAEIRAMGDAPGGIRVRRR